MVRLAEARRGSENWEPQRPWANLEDRRPLQGTEGSVPRMSKVPDMALQVPRGFSDLSERSRAVAELLFLGALGLCVYALVLGDSRGEIIVGLIALGVTLLAIGLAISEIQDSVARGKLERLWALEARWMSKEAVEARLVADALLAEMQGTGRPMLAAWDALEDGLEIDPRMRRRQAMMVLNIVEEFAEAAYRDYADQDRLRRNYGSVFTHYRREWAFVVEHHLQPAEGYEGGLPIPVGRSFGYLDHEARRAGYEDIDPADEPIVGR